MERESDVFVVGSAYRVVFDCFNLWELLVSCLHSGSWTPTRFISSFGVSDMLFCMLGRRGNSAFPVRSSVLSAFLSRLRYRLQMGCLAAMHSELLCFGTRRVPGIDCEDMFKFDP